jgi:hypothetical protein
VLPFPRKKEGAGSVGPGDFTSRPSRPGESHPKPLTDSGLEPVAGEITIRQPQVVRESHNRSPWRSTSKSTKTSFAGFSPVITDRHRNSGGTSWLTLLGHTKDGLCSMDLFRCESATMGTHWVLVVIDQYTRRIIGLLASSSSSAAQMNPTTGESSRDFPMLAACPQSTPLVPVLTDIS